MLLPPSALPPQDPAPRGSVKDGHPGTMLTLACSLPRLALLERVCFINTGY